MISHRSGPTHPDGAWLDAVVGVLLQAHQSDRIQLRRKIPNDEHLEAARTAVVKLLGRINTQVQ